MHEKGALPRDVIKIPALSGGTGKKERVDHPTQKPLLLCEKLLGASRNKEGADPSVYRQKKLGIKHIGYEINKEYIKIAKKRLDDLNM